MINMYIIRFLNNHDNFEIEIKNLRGSSLTCIFNQAVDIHTYPLESWFLSDRPSYMDLRDKFQTR